MRDGVVVAALIVCVLSGCNVPETPPDADHPLVGTWQLVEWRAQDGLGVWQEVFGTQPLGYFVYGASGHLSIHLMHEAGGAVSDCAPPSENNLVLPACYVGYFGTYRIEPGDSVVIHQPVGGTILSYIGTNQPRRFEVRGTPCGFSVPKASTGFSSGSTSLSTGRRSSTRCRGRHLTSDCYSRGRHQARALRLRSPH